MDDCVIALAEAVMRPRDARPSRWSIRGEFGRARLRPSLARRGSDGASPSRTPRCFRASKDAPSGMRARRPRLSRSRIRYYPGKNEPHVGQAFRPDFHHVMSGRKA